MSDRTLGVFSSMCNGIVVTGLLTAFLFAAPLSPHRLGPTIESVDPPLINERAAAMSELEEEMVDMINDERTQRGLAALEPDSQLARVARRHSQDMIERNYFSHNNPEGKDGFARMRDAKIRFRAAAENLAYARTLEIAHNGLMRSPGHRVNILSQRYGRVGVGIVKGPRGLMITQEFRD